MDVNGGAPSVGGKDPALRSGLMEPPAPGVDGGSAGSRVGSSRLGNLRRAVPQEYRNELVQLVKLAGPVVISQLMVFLVGIISMVFCGHLGKMELAGVSLAAAVVNVTGVSVGTGLSSACDTLISQTYGSGNMKRVGVILQRGVLILLLACFPCWAVLINTEPILLAARQSPEVARISQLYVKIFMPALPASFMYQLQGKYLQNQGIMWPQVLTGVVGNVLNIVINYVFLYPLQLGVAGSAAANAISQYVLALLLWAYIWWRGLHKATWGGWTLDCLQEWGPFVGVAVPSMLMICLAWWLFEVGGFLAGMISEVELGAQSIAYNLSIVAYMCPLGFSGAASVRVGNALGAGNIKQAKLSSQVPIICGFVFACLIGGSFSMARHVIGYVFTSEPDIIQRVADVMLVFVFMHIGDATAGVAAGVLRGAGKQLVGALLNFVGFYFVGFPIGVALMFAADMGIVGLWTGLTICVVLQSTTFILVLWKLNWKKAAAEASVRAGVHNTEDKEVQLKLIADQDYSDRDLDLDPDLHPVSQVREFSATVVGDVLSVTQLVLRRGLVLVTMVLILASGIIVSAVLMELLH